ASRPTPRSTRPWRALRPRPQRCSKAVDSVAPGQALGAPRQPLVSIRDRADVALVGYQDQGNLGMGYLAAVLQRHGSSVEMIDVRLGGEKIAAQLASRQPLVVGFSLIFQFFLPQF